MPLVADLVTRMTADNSPFYKAMDEAESKANKFGKKLAKVGAGIALAVGTVAVGGFTILLKTINSTADEIDKLAKRAKKFGSDVAAFQRLEYIASLAGVEVSKLESGMGRLVKSMADAKRGVGEANDAFKELGLSVDELDKMSMDKQYIAISDAIKTIPDANRQAQLAVQIFGRSGVEQLNLLREDLSGLSADFDKFGGALTNKQAEAVEKYNDSVTRLGAVFSVFRIQLTAQVAPALEMIVNWIADLTLKYGGLGPLANKVAQLFVSGLQGMVAGVQGVLTFIDRLILGVKKVQLVLLEFDASLDKFAFASDFDLGVGDAAGNRMMDTYDKIAKIRKQIQESEKNRGPGVTAPLQQGLQGVQSTLQAQSKQQVEVKISTEKGLQAEVANSPEVQAKIKESINRVNAIAASAIGN